MASSTTADNSPTNSPKQGSLALAADPRGRLSYIPTILRASAGTITIVFTNQSPLRHNLTVASKTGRVLQATPTFMGGSHTLTMKLKPGRYTFYCTVPGHRAAGMHGTLIVR